MRFFKCGPGEYREGDCFLGISVPDTRALLKRTELDLGACVSLLESEWHEARLLALLGMVRLYQKGTTATKRAVFTAYLKHAPRINNWDLVDCSAEYVVGPELCGKDGKALAKLARSKLLWERRIAMIATLHAIKAGACEDAFRIATLLLQDDEDLIHKAVGWMLREVGKRCSKDELRGFLRQHAKTMPRTALRYAIEHLDPAERAKWMR